MNILKLTPRFLSGPIIAALACLVMRPAPCSGVVEETFDVLQIGTHTYQNVTVTTKAKKYIVIIHSSGMNTLKVKDLSPDLPACLGYHRVLEEETPKSGAASLSTWTQHPMSKIGLRQLNHL